MKKLANPDTILGAFRHGFLQSLKSPATLGLLAAPFAAAGVRKYEQHRQAQDTAQRKALAYREMMELHPHFKQRDQAEIGRIYNSLHNASPHMARDAMVAGAWVDNILENRLPGMNSHQALLTAVKDLNGIQKNVSDIDRNRAVSPLADKTDRWIRDYGDRLDAGLNRGLDMKFEEHNKQVARDQEGLQRSMDNLTAAQTKHRNQIASQALDKRIESIMARERALEQREGRGKTSSARTPLGDMLRALKV